jgi:hypothetical protein
VGPLEVDSLEALAGGSVVGPLEGDPLEALAGGSLEAWGRNSAVGALEEGGSFSGCQATAEGFLMRQWKRHRLALPIVLLLGPHHRATLNGPKTRVSDIQ